MATWILVQDCAACVMRNNKRAVIIGASGLIVLLFTLIFVRFVGKPTVNQKELAVKLLEEGRWDLAGRIARELENQQAIDKDTDSTWNFVRGVSLFLSASDRLDLPQNREVLWEAIQHLEASEKLGFPLGTAGRGQFFLGSSYFNTYQWKKAIDKLKESIPDWPERRSDALRMAVLSSIRQQPIDVEGANKSLAQWKSIPGLSNGELAKIALSEAELALKLGDNSRCEELLTSAPVSPSLQVENEFMRGRWRLEVANNTSPEGRQWLAEAEQQFRKCVLAPETSDELRRQASYFLGRVQRLKGNQAEALSTFSGVRQRNPQSPEASAAGIEEAEILMEMDRIDACLSTVGQVLQQLGSLSVYNEQWVTIAQMRARLSELGGHLRAVGQYDKAIALSKMLPVVFPLADSVRMQADVYITWAESLMQASQSTTDRAFANEQKKLSNDKMINAGQEFERLAQLEMKTPVYPDVLWQAIECYEKANSPSNSLRLLDDYLRSEDRAKRPRGLLAVGEKHVNAGRWDDALNSLQKCLDEFPEHPVCYEARILSARAQTEMLNFDEAQELLLQNLYDGSLKPSSEAWLTSMLELGHTIFKAADNLVLEAKLDQASDKSLATQKLEESQRKFADAIQHLREATVRYKNDPKFGDDRRYFQSRYLIGKSSRLAADLPSQLTNRQQQLIETERRQMQQQRRQLLEAARDEFRDLHRELSAFQENQGMSEHQKLLLRNCYFGEADALFELGRFEDAITAYRNVGNRFLNQPEALEALAQIAQCYRSMGQPEQAKRTLLQAEQVLKRIPTDFDEQFAKLTRADRLRWGELLTWMQKW